MVDKVTKSLRKLSTKEKIVFKKIFLQIENSDFKGLNLTKLQDRDDIYRIRKGKFRVIFRQCNDEDPDILYFGRRDDNIYKNKSW